MTFKDLWEYLVSFINRIKPSLESLLVGALLAGLAAVGDYLTTLILNGGNGKLDAFLTGQTVFLIFAGAFINFITSTVRRIYTRRVISGQPVDPPPPTSVIVPEKQV